MGKKPHPRLLKSLQIVSYLSLILLWFRHNFPALKGLSISPVFPFAVFMTITLYRVLPWLFNRLRDIKIRPHPSFWIITGLILLTLAFRLPFLTNQAIISDGDDGLIILQAKHIAEGEAPSIYNYGVNYESSTLMHLYALLFKVFGYSPNILRLAALAIYCGFIGILFLLLRRLFGIGFAALAGLFLSLPLGHNIIASLNLSGDFPTILFLGSLILFLTFKIRYESNDRLLPVLGFLLGLTFWVHQMTISFILTSIIFLCLHYRGRIKQYFITVGYAVMGGFPIVISEVFTGFSLSRFLLSGERGSMRFADQIKRSYASLSYLVTRQDTNLTPVLMGMILAGAVGLLLLGIKKKSLRPGMIFLAFPVLFFFIYFMSSFSTRYILAVRYFYPLIFVLPVLLFGYVLFLPQRFRFAAGAAFLILVLVHSNWAGYREDIKRIQVASQNLSEVLQALDETGQKYWLADFWDAFLVTTLSSEKLIVSEHFSPGHYPGYLLEYCSRGRNNNLLFLNEPGLYTLAYREMMDLLRGNLRSKLDHSRKIMAMLDKFGIEYQAKSIGNNQLIYNVKEDLPISIWRIDSPAQIPDYRIENISYDRSALKMTLHKSEGLDWFGFRIQAEIPEFSTTLKEIPNEMDSWELRLPFSGSPPSEIHLYLNYFGIKVPASRRIVTCPPPPQKEWMGKRILIRSGVGSFVSFEKKSYQTCEKEMLLEVKPIAGVSKALNIRIFSPLNFDQPNWYRPFEQSMEIKINGRINKKIPLKPGDNFVSLTEIGQAEYAGQTIQIEISFRYQFYFHFLPGWRIAALLENIELE